MPSAGSVRHFSSHFIAEKSLKRVKQRPRSSRLERGSEAGLPPPSASSWKKGVWGGEARGSSEVWACVEGRSGRPVSARGLVPPLPCGAGPWTFPEDLFCGQWGQYPLL